MGPRGSSIRITGFRSFSFLAAYAGVPTATAMRVSRAMIKSDMRFMVHSFLPAYQAQYSVVASLQPFTEISRWVYASWRDESLINEITGLLWRLKAPSLDNPDEVTVVAIAHADAIERTSPRAVYRTAVFLRYVHRRPGERISGRQGRGTLAVLDDVRYR